MESTPPNPSGFSSITQKREKIFSSNLVTSVIDKWITIYIIKLEDRPFLLAMATAQIKGVKDDIFEKIFSQFWLQNGISIY